METTAKERLEAPELNDFLEDLEPVDSSDYAQWLDEVYEPVEIAGMTIYASEMEERDPVMFRCGFSDWTDSEARDGNFVEHEGEYYKADEYNEALAEYEEALEEYENQDDEE